MQYFRPFIELCSFSGTEMKTLGTQSVPSQPAQSKKKKLLHAMHAYVFT